jgi:serine phosphatase RsbU (regulator of sigma subunit)
MVDPDGHDIVVAFANIPGTPWKLITEDEWGILNSPNRTYINWLLFAMILGIVFSITGLIVFIRLRNRELDRMSEAENDTHVARQLKQKLLPKQVPLLPGWNLKVFHKPADEVSGDYYDFMYLQDGRLMLVMAEVSGRGVPAMLKLATLRAGLRGAGQRLLSPAEALEFSGALLCSEPGLDAEVKCLVAVFDPASGQFNFACAGQAQAYHQNGAGASILATPGAPLGSGLDNHYQQNQTVLRPGERTLLSCDSIIGVKNNVGELFGEQRLLDVLTREHEDDIPAMDLLINELRTFSGNGWEPEGDLIILLLESVRED